jgi:hypothetical protein
VWGGGEERNGKRLSPSIDFYIALQVYKFYYKIIKLKYTHSFQQTPSPKTTPLLYQKKKQSRENSKS